MAKAGVSDYSIIEFRAIRKVEDNRMKKKITFLTGSPSSKYENLNVQYRSKKIEHAKVINKLY